MDQPNFGLHSCLYLVLIDVPCVHKCAIPAGSVLRCDVTGKILMKCFLSGMPDLKLGLNDKIGLEKEAQLKSRPAKR
jgi:hypothetical protein